MASPWTPEGRRPSVGHNASNSSRRPSQEITRGLGGSPKPLLPLASSSSSPRPRGVHSNVIADHVYDHSERSGVLAAGEQLVGLGISSNLWDGRKSSTPDRYHQHEINGSAIHSADTSSDTEPRVVDARGQGQCLIALLSGPQADVDIPYIRSLRS